MTRSLALGAVLGGLVAFGWSAVSWMVLPWHDTSMKSFADEAAVAQGLLDNAPSGGMFMLPGLPPGYERMSGAEKEAAEAAMAKKQSEGPYRYGVVWRRVRQDMGRQMGVALLFDILTGWTLAGMVIAKVAAPKAA